MSSISPAPLRGQEVFNWLHRLELSHQFDKFLDNGFDELSYCRKIGESELQAIGITDIHERLALLQAIRLLHVNQFTPGRNIRKTELTSGSWRGPNNSGNVGLSVREEIELQVFKNKSRVLFYNNNAYLDSKYQTRVDDGDNGDYSECADFDVANGSSSSVCANCYNCDRDGAHVGGCNCSRDEPFYESVLLPSASANPNYQPPPLHRNPQGTGVLSREHALQQQHQLQRDLSLRSQLRDQAMQDGINFSRIPDETALRAFAAKYASELSCTTAINTGGGGGTSFSSTSSTSSGYPSSLATTISASSKGLGSSSSTGSSSSSWIREGLPLLEFQQQVLLHLREIWLEERKKFSCNNGRTSSTSESLMSPCSSSSSSVIRGFSSSPSATVDNLYPSHTFLLQKQQQQLQQQQQQLLGEMMMMNAMVNAGNNGRSPKHQTEVSEANGGSNKTPYRQQKQNGYLQHNGNMSNMIPPHLNPSSSNASFLNDRQNYNPGVYQPSSCLRDREDIYDYIPPRIKGPEDLIVDDDGTESPVPHCSKQRAATLTRYQTLSRYQQLQQRGTNKSKDKTYGFLRSGSSVTSPRRIANSASNNHTSNRFSTLNRVRNPPTSGPKSSMSSFTISGSCSSSSNNSSNSVNNAYGFVSGFPYASYSRGNGEETVGCRTLVNLHKLGRRLGLTRFFRTLRIQNPDGSGETCTRQYLNSTGSSSSSSSDRVLFGLSPCSAETLGRLRRFQSESARFSPTKINLEEETNENLNEDSNNESNSEPGAVSNELEDVKEPSHTPLSSLPSNERIIETINRLKYEELQKRKERIAQEHQMMLKELKGSLSGGGGGESNGSGPSSIFYVSRSGEDTTGHTLPATNVITTTGPPTTSDYFEDDEEIDGDEETYEEPFDSANLARDQNPRKSNNNTRTSKKLGSRSSLPNFPGGGDNPQIWELTPGTTTTAKRLPICSTSDQNLNEGEEEDVEQLGSLGSSAHSNSKRSFKSGCVGSLSNEPGQRSSYGSNASRTSSSSESFSEIFARHLRSRLNNKQSLGSNDKKEEGESEILSRTGSSRNGSEVGGGGGGGDGVSRTSSGFLSRVRQGGSRNKSSSSRDSLRTRQEDGQEEEEGRDEGRLTCGEVESFRNSSEEELTSINSLSVNETSGGYDGPFDGRAIALVDSTPSPYDRHALRYKKGDIIQIISKKPTGLWTGKVNNQIGNFKFINVRMLPLENLTLDESKLNPFDFTETLNNKCSCEPDLQTSPGDQQNQQSTHNCHHHSKNNPKDKRESKGSKSSISSWDTEERQNIVNVMNGNEENPEEEKGSPTNDKTSSSSSRALNRMKEESQQSPRTTPRKKSGSLRKGRPESVGDLLHRIHLDEHISLFILHGFETLDLFKELEEEDLDRLEILGDTDRARILTAVELLREYDTEDSGSSCSFKRVQRRKKTEQQETQERPPAQTLYQYQYYQQHTPKREEPCSLITTAAVQVHHNNGQSQNKGSTLYRFNNHPRDSGIFVGKCEDGEEDVMDVGVGCPESFSSVICGEDPGESSHPDAETEIILSPINLHKSNSTWSNSNHHANSRLISANSSKNSPVNQNSNSASPNISRVVGASQYWPVYLPTNQVENKKSIQQNSYSGVNAGSLQQPPRNVKQDPYTDVRNRFIQAKTLFETNGLISGIVGPSKTSPNSSSSSHNYDNIDEITSAELSNKQQNQSLQNNSSNRSFLYCEKSSDSGISTNSPPPLRNEYRS